MEKRLGLFFGGFFVVLCVTIQTWFIAKNFMPGIAVVGFLISFIWSFNVKKIAFGGMADRVVYSMGASAGAVCGLMVGREVLI